MKHAGARAAFFLLISLLAPAARADVYLLGETVGATGASPLHPGWQGTMSLGYLATRGNSNTTSYNAKAAGTYLDGRWQHMLLGQWLGASDTGMTTASSHELNAQSDYALNDSHYLFGYLDDLGDSFSGYQRRLTELAGYGYKAVDTQSQQLSLEAGAGARQTRFVDGSRRSAPVERLALNYLWKLSVTSSFSELLSLEHGVDDTYIQSATALTANLFSSFALSVSFTVKHNTRPLMGFKPTDASTAVSLVYSF